MATQILRTDRLNRVVRLMEDSADNDGGGRIELRQEYGNIFLGFVMAMLFNLILVILGTAAWEVWRHIR